MARTKDYNPYAPGRDGDPPDVDDDRHAFRPATLGQRFLGALVDGLFNLTIAFVMRIVMSGVPTSWADFFGPRALQEHAVAILLAALLPLGIMAWLIATRGQSLGKIVMGTRIVDQDGRRAGLFNGFVLRTLPFAALGNVPTVLMAAGMSFQDTQPFSVLLSLVSVVDIALILGAYRRCLHDRIAGTYVAVVGTERAPRDDAPRLPRKKKKRRKAAPAAAGEA